jgi:3-oxoacyl-[acyl-carrier-protein] synthase-3
MYVNIERYGNTSSASIPVALDELVRAGRIKLGDCVGFSAFGGGATWGSSIMRWTRARIEPGESDGATATKVAAAKESAAVTRPLS